MNYEVSPLMFKMSENTYQKMLKDVKMLWQNGLITDNDYLEVLKEAKRNYINNFK